MKELVLAAALLTQSGHLLDQEPAMTSSVSLPTTEIQSPVPENPLPVEAGIINDIIDGFLEIDKNSPFYQDMLDNQRNSFEDHFNFTYTEDELGTESTFEYFPEGKNTEHPIDKISYLFQTNNVVLEDQTIGQHLQTAMSLRVGEDGTLEDSRVASTGRFSEDEMKELVSKYLVNIPPLEMAQWHKTEDGTILYKDAYVGGVYMSVNVSSDGLIVSYQEFLEKTQ